MFNTKLSLKTVLTIVINDKLYFISFDRKGRGTVLHGMSLDQFLSDDPESAAIPDQLKDKTNALLILPDYWSGNASYLFQSRRISLAKAFIERKLSTEYPDLPDINYFFDFSYHRTELENREVNVFFLQEPKAFQLYDKLFEYKLNPIRISTPALLWEQKLINMVPDFDIGGTSFVHLLPSECFLYFFSGGHFVFSRLITIPEVQVENNANGQPPETTDIYNIITYEINQSLYLFSQKSKSEMGKICLLSCYEDSARVLSESLGKEITDINASSPDLKGLQESPGIQEYLGSIGSFTTAELSSSKSQLNLTHSSLKKMLEWKPVQTIGMVLGFALLLLLTVESFYLWGWTSVNRELMAESRSFGGVKQKQLVREYSRALDMIIAETDRTLPRNVIINVGKALPDNAWVTDMDVETESNPGVVIHGVIKATGAEQLSNTLSKLLENLNLSFQGTRSLRIKDIDFKVDKSLMSEETKNFLFTLKFNLP